jgi:hypothetical protein
MSTGTADWKKNDFADFVDFFLNRDFWDLRIGRILFLDE